MDELSYGENSYDDLDKTFSTRLDILSCKSPAPTVSAKLDSNAIVDKNLIVHAVIANNGEDNNFIISASGYDSWANLVSITPQSMEITKGGTKEVTITLLPKVSGAHSFKINTIVDGDVYNQSLSVNIAEKQGILNWVNDKIGTNTFYVIVTLIAIVILLFLIVVVAILKRPSRRQHLG